MDDSFELSLFQQLSNTELIQVHNTFCNAQGYTLIRMFQTFPFIMLSIPSDCFEYPQKSLLKSSYPKKYLPKFSNPQKFPKSKISKNSSNTPVT